MTRFLASELALSHYYDISKAKRLLDYNPSYPIAKGIHQTVKWYLDANSS